MCLYVALDHAHKDLREVHVKHIPQLHTLSFMIKRGTHAIPSSIYTHLTHLYSTYANAFLSLPSVNSLALLSSISLDAKESGA
jgi:hypothetical protein